MHAQVVLGRSDFSPTSQKNFPPGWKKTLSTILICLLTPLHGEIVSFVSHISVLTEKAILFASRLSLKEKKKHYTESFLFTKHSQNLLFLTILQTSFLYLLLVQHFLQNIAFDLITFYKFVTLFKLIDKNKDGTGIQSCAFCDGDTTMCPDFI